MGERSEAQDGRYCEFLRENAAEKVAVLEIGCGGAVPTIRNMVEEIFYKSSTAKLIRINLDG
jgi:hypothetical protein